jgi:hypothetical protein
VTEVLDWTHRTGDVPSRGLDVDREAGEQEREGLCAALELVSCGRLKVRYRIRPLDQGRYAVSGMLEAEITQSCVVTLDPLVSRIKESFEAEYWPEAEGDAPGGHIDTVALDEPEFIRNGIIGVGSLIVDRLAIAIDSYPRKPGAVFEWPDAADEQRAADSPFAALKNFTSKR